MKVFLKSWIFVLVAAIVFLSPAPESAAQDQKAVFALRPARFDPDRPETRSYFVYDVEAGRQFEDQIRIINTGEQPGLVRLYAVDAATGQNSGPVYLQSDAQRQDVGAWITLDVNELTLQPGEEQLIGFTVQVPTDVRAGEHLGGIVAEGATIIHQANESNVAVNMQVRTVVAVQVNLAGSRVDQLLATGLSMDVQNAQQMITVSLHNQGTHMAKGAGAIALFAEDGTQLADVPIRLESILPEDLLDFSALIPLQALPVGRYRAEFTFTTAEGHVVPKFTAMVEVSETQVEEIYAAQPQLPPPVFAAKVNPISWFPLIFAVISAGFLALYVVRRLHIRL